MISVALDQQGTNIQQRFWLYAVFVRMMCGCIFIVVGSGEGRSKRSDCTNERFTFWLLGMVLLGCDLCCCLGARFIEGFGFGIFMRFLNSTTCLILPLEFISELLTNQCAPEYLFENVPNTSSNMPRKLFGNVRNTCSKMSRNTCSKMP